MGGRLKYRKINAEMVPLKSDKDPYVQMKRLYDYDEENSNSCSKIIPISDGFILRQKDRDGLADEVLALLLSPTALKSGTEHWLNSPEFWQVKDPGPDCCPGQMLNLGYRIYGTANSDAHVVSHATGSVFSYIYTANDNPENIDEVELAQQVKDGHVVISNGPFMDVRMNGSFRGEEIKLTDGKVAVKVKVMTSNWCLV